MMGFQTAAARFFYDFCLDDHVPKDHPLRALSRASLRSALFKRYDEPETLPSSICLICPTSADGGQPLKQERNDLQHSA